MPFPPTIGNTPFAFQPLGGASLACTSTTGSVALSGDGNQAVVTNYGTKVAFVEFGASGVEATTSSLAVLPGTQVVLTIPYSAGTVKSTHMAGITASASDTTTLQVSTGNGV